MVIKLSDNIALRNSREFVGDTFKDVNNVPFSNQLRLWIKSDLSIWVVSQISVHNPDKITVHPLVIDEAQTFGIHEQQVIEHPETGIELRIVDKNKIRRRMEEVMMRGYGL